MSYVPIHKSGMDFISIEKEKVMVIGITVLGCFIIFQVYMIIRGVFFVAPFRKTLMKKIRPYALKKAKEGCEDEKEA